MKELKENVPNFSARKSYISDKPDIPKELITIYVESEDDIPYWHRIFTKYTSGLYFRINPAVREDGAMGKEIVLDFLNSANKTFLLCIDSDYDYLLCLLSNDNGKEDFVFQTYTYSIENYKCYAESLHSLCVRASLNDERIFDFVGFLKKYSESVYELFLYSLYFEKHSDTQLFCREALGDCVRLCDFINSNKDFDSDFLIDKLKERVKENIEKLEINKSISSNELEFMSKDLECKLGLNKYNTYLFIKGHVIFEDVVLTILKKLVEKLIKNLRDDIRNKYKNQQGRIQQTYSNKIERSHLETLLYHNTDYDSCFLIEKIRVDIESYVKKYWQNTR